MPRFRLRLATLGLLIVIIALLVALVVQRRRESAMNDRIRQLENEREVLQEMIARTDRLLKIERQKTAVQARTPPGDGQDSDRKEPIDSGRQ